MMLAFLIAQSIILTQPGVIYNLPSDLTVSTIGIRVAASDVTIDLRGHTIHCTGEGPTFGIYAVSAERLTVTNGAVTGCLLGIAVAHSVDSTIKDIDFTGNRGIGLSAMGSIGLIARDSTFARIAGADGYAVGLSGPGSMALVEGNTFAELYPPDDGEAVAILIDTGSEGVMIRANSLSNVHEDFETIGVWIGAGARDVTVDGNRIVGFARAVLADRVYSVTATHNVLELATSQWGSIGIHLPNCIVCEASGNAISGFETLITLPPR